MRVIHNVDRESSVKELICQAGAGNALAYDEDICVHGAKMRKWVA
jgi:hypothetical protein